MIARLFSIGHAHLEPIVRGDNAVPNATNLKRLILRAVQEKLCRAGIVAFIIWISHRSKRFQIVPDKYLANLLSSVSEKSRALRALVILT